MAFLACFTAWAVVLVGDRLKKICLEGKAVVGRVFFCSVKEQLGAI